MGVITYPFKGPSPLTALQGQERSLKVKEVKKCGDGSWFLSEHGWGELFKTVGSAQEW